MARQSWESKYEEFKNGKMQDEIDNLISKMSEIKAEQAQLKEGNEYGKKKVELEKTKKQIVEARNKITAIEKNASKIENILNFKKELVSRTAKLIDKQNEYETMVEGNKTLQKSMAELNKERDELSARIKEIQSELKNPKLTDEEKEKLESEKQSKLEKALENDQKFIEAQSKHDETEIKLGEYNEEEIKAEILKNEKLLGKCDLIGANLVKGKNMEDITASLNKFEFTPNKDFAKKIKEARKGNNKDEKKENKQEEIKENEGEIQEGNVVEQEKEESKLVKTINKLKQRFPFIDKVINKVKSVFSGKEKLAEGQNNAKESKGTIEEVNKDFEYVMNKMNEENANDYLMGIAEKGTSGIRAELRKNLQDKRESKRGEGYVPLPKKSGLREALLRQDEIANGGVPPRESDDGERN